MAGLRWLAAAALHFLLLLLAQTSGVSSPPEDWSGRQPIIVQFTQYRSHAAQASRLHLLAGSGVRVLGRRAALPGRLTLISLPLLAVSPSKQQALLRYQRPFRQTSCS